MVGWVVFQASGESQVADLKLLLILYFVSAWQDS